MVTMVPNVRFERQPPEALSHIPDHRLCLWPSVFAKSNVGLDAPIASGARKPIPILAKRSPSGSFLDPRLLETLGGGASKTRFAALVSSNSLVPKRSASWPRACPRMHIVEIRTVKIRSVHIALWRQELPNE